MKKQNIYKIKILTAIFCLFISSCADGQANKTSKTPETKNSNRATSADVNEVLKKQILLTNAAKFSGNRTLEGASGFLIKYYCANFAVTARHLLGEAGGVEPEVKINDLGKYLINWEMMPRVVGNAAKETVKLDAKGLDFSQSASDLVLLKVVSNGFEIESLTPNFNLPAVGETLFLVGCPYSETKCKQNSYPVKFVEFDETENSLVFETNATVDFSGFSGAPVINAKGEVFGALVGGGASGGKTYVTATRINEIQKIKF